MTNERRKPTRGECGEIVDSTPSERHAHPEAIEAEPPHNPLDAPLQLGSVIAEIGFRLPADVRQWIASLHDSELALAEDIILDKGTVNFIEHWRTYRAWMWNL